MHDARSSALVRAWRKFPLRSQHAWLNWLLLFVPAALVLHWSGASPMVLFLAAAAGIIPLAGVLGEATEALAARLGPTLGGILNATMGNATELIIAFFALRIGHTGVVKASLSGSIIGNLLLVLGLSIVIGGIGRTKQKFSRDTAGTNSTMLFIAVVALIMPAVFDLSVFGNLKQQNPIIEDLSLWTSGVLIVIYLISFVFVLKTHKQLFSPSGDEHGHKDKNAPNVSIKQSAFSLIAATVLIGFLSEMLVGEIDAVTKSIGMTELFVGVIVVAIIGNAAEHSSAIIMARRNQMDLAMTIAIGSSTQIALFVAPLLVFLSVAIGHPMSLVFTGLEIAAIVLSVLIVEMISYDGETNWFEGAELLAVYAILAVSFYFVPG
jgi:Ca2+:H+ antiporter